MSTDYLITSWKEVRDGFIDEVNQIPAEQFGFRATAETRSVTELVQHVVQSQKMIAGEACRDEPNLMRQSFADHNKEYASEVESVTDKNGLLELLRSSMDVTEANIRTNAERLQKTMRRFDGKEISRLDFIRFAVGHEMYHRGQLTVFARLLNIEPALTQKFKKLFAQSGSTS